MSEMTDVERLCLAKQMLDMLHRRNKNQHRRSHWFRWLATLGRSTARFLLAFQREDVTGMAAYVLHLTSRILPKCYSVFTQLIRDPQFSTLGLALIAELAEIRQSVEAVATQRHLLVSQVPACHTPNTERDPHSRPGEDVGEAVCRPPLAALVSTSLVPSPEKPLCPQKPQDDGPSPISMTGGKDLETATSCSTVPNESSTRRKQKSRNPIDDLFSRLD